MIKGAKTLEEVVSSLSLYEQDLIRKRSSELVLKERLTRLVRRARENANKGLGDSWN